MIRNMKKIMMIMVLGALVACLVPANAQNQQDWKTTSSMQASGSVLAPQVTAVGATGVAQQASTTTDYSASNVTGRSIRRSKENPTDPGTTTDTSSPLGDAVWPLMLMALAYLGVRVFFRRKRALKG